MSPKEQIVKVTWFDASYEEGGRFPREHLENVTPYTNTTAGFLVRQDEDCVVIAHEIDNPQDDHRPMLYAGLACIPKVCIVLIEAMDTNGELKESA